MAADRDAPRPIHCALTVNDRRWQLRAWPGPGEAVGPPIILVHGLGATPAYFRPLAECLSRSCPAIAPNLPGFGGTERRRGERSISAIATALAEYWTAAGTAPALFIGHSLGAQIVTSLAATHPELVAGVALVSPAPDPFGGGLISHTARLLLDAPREPFALLRLLIPRYLTAGVNYVTTTVRAMDRYRWEPDLPRVAAPALVIRGERDPVASRLWVTTLARDLSARLVVVPDAPHGLIYSHPDVVADALLSFHEEISLRGGRVTDSPVQQDKRRHSTDAVRSLHVTSSPREMGDERRPRPRRHARLRPHRARGE